MRYTFPEYFRHTGKPSRLKLDDVTFVKFHTYEDSGKQEICLTTNLLAFILQGEKKIQDLEQEWRFTAGQGMFLRQNHYVMSNVCPASGQAFQNFVFLIGDAYLAGFVERHEHTFKKQPIGPVKDVCKFIIPPLLRSSIDSVIPYFQHPHKHTPALLQLKLDEILMQVLLAEPTGAIWSALRAAARAIPIPDLKAFMERHYAKPWPLETFAAQSNRSLSKFKKDFQTAFPKESPKHWINRKRLERAAFLMQNTDWPVTEVGYLAGFENLSYFIQLFKKSYRVTPKQWQLAENQQKKSRV
jgi:AraC-like DNA-binding protein